MDTHTDLYAEIEKSFPKIEKLFTEEFLQRFSQIAPDNLEQYCLELCTIIRLKLLQPRNALYKKICAARMGQHKYNGDVSYRWGSSIYGA